MLDALEQRITDLLSNNGATDTQIEMYIDDIFSFGDKEAYEGYDDNEIVNDFEMWMEN